MNTVSESIDEILTVFSARGVVEFEKDLKKGLTIENIHKEVRTRYPNQLYKLFETRKGIYVLKKTI